jgi:peptidoglycan/LPS O-acetylase OafA/YrhL
MYFPHLRVWYINILLSLPLTVAVAAMSWHFVEAPTLALKSRVKGFAAKENAFLSPYVVRFGLAMGLICYGIVMLHWSGLEAALQFSPRKHWISMIVGALALAVLVTNGRKLLKAEPAAA